MDGNQDARRISIKESRQVLSWFCSVRIEASHCGAAVDAIADEVKTGQIEGSGKEARKSFAERGDPNTYKGNYRIIHGWKSIFA